MTLAEIKDTINELCFHIFFQTPEGKTLLAALEKYYCTTENIYHVAKEKTDMYGGVDSYIAFQLGKKSFIYDLKRFGEIQKQKIQEAMRKQENDSTNPESSSSS